MRRELFPATATDEALCKIAANTGERTPPAETARASAILASAARRVPPRTHSARTSRSSSDSTSTGLVLGWTGWQALLVGTFAGFALAAVYGGVLLAAHRATRTSQLPLGPFILLGALAAIAL